MELKRFFPYRVAVLAESVSQSLAQVYAERFGLTRDEWRVLAVLAEVGTAKTTDVIESTTLDKMRVSRAVTRMEEAELVERQPNPEDGRGWLLRLRPAGRSLFHKVVPVVTARERFLLDALSPEEFEVLDRALDKLRDRAQLLAQQG
jgi:DNA-binding MarR family transcriptional regulator